MLAYVLSMHEYVLIIDRSIDVMPPARDRALLMPEVVELILLQLPLQDLLVNAQRVNHLFHDLIASSRCLQQALFFRPTQASSHGEMHPNSLLEKNFPPWFEGIWMNLKYRLLSHHKKFMSLDWNSNKAKAEAYARKEASWRRMLVAQPPVHDLIVKIHAQEMIGAPNQSRGELKLNDGLRMGLLYDLVQDFLEHQPTGYFLINWFLSQQVSKDHDGEVVGSDDGNDKSYILIDLCHALQCRAGLKGRIGPEFKSLAYEPVSIKYTSVRAVLGLIG